eukprot:359193-Chlamydomonas_euryale.AAC.1
MEERRVALYDSLECCDGQVQFATAKTRWGCKGGCGPHRAGGGVSHAVRLARVLRRPNAVCSGKRWCGSGCQ